MKRLFEALDEINQEDTLNKTANVGVMPDFVSANKTKLDEKWKIK